MENENGEGTETVSRYGVPGTRPGGWIEDELTCRCHSHSGFLTKAGYALVAQRSSGQIEIPGMGLTQDEKSVTLSLPVSVSALFEFELSDRLFEEQYQRFHNGS